MSVASETAAPPPIGRRIRRFMSDWPIIPMIVLLVLLVAVLEVLRPGIVNERWVANTVKFAIPLAILASCQTLTMLTGGIDLSAGTVATMGAFIMATQVPVHGPALAILIALVPAVLVGLANGVGVGIFSLQNLSLGVLLSIPFTDKPASLLVSISERHHPFLVSVSLFGGGGFFALGVSARGVESVEAAIEFGGSIALNLGIASGGVEVMAGIYFGLTGTTTTLTGYLRCGGYLEVLGLISISVEFYLGFTYLDRAGGGPEVWGQARVTVCVKVAFFSKSVSLSVERRFAGASGDPTFDDCFDPADWEQYALAFAA